MQKIPRYGGKQRGIKEILDEGERRVRKLP